MNFKPYPSYKPCDIKWFNEIPENWSQVRVNQYLLHSEINIGDLWNSTQLLSLTQKGIIKKDINSGKGKTHSDYSTYQTVEKGDFVFCLFDIDETPRTIGLSKESGMITSAYSIFKPKENINSKYVYYFFENIDDAKALKPYYKGLRKTVRPPEFLKINLPFPPLYEQNKIVSFLDSETSRIDNLIAKQEKLIEVLEEYRNTLTAHTIEKGIKSNTKMINSGVEWLGEVPENWKVGRLKNFAKVNPTIKKFSLDADELIEFIPMSNVDDKKGVIASIDYRKFGEVSTGYTAFNTSDVVFAKITPCMENGNCAIISELKHGFGYGTTEFIVFRPSSVIKTEFLYFLLRSKKLRDICTAFMTGTAGQQRISSEFLANYPIALPDLQEQQENIDFLHEKNKKIDNLIYKQKALILKLKEYRTSIISHAVTGKIDVRDLVV